MDFIDTHIKEHYGLSGFGIFQVITYLATIIVSIICARSPIERVHAIWGILFFIFMSIFEYLNFRVLRAN